MKQEENEDIPKRMKKINNFKIHLKSDIWFLAEELAQIDKEEPEY